MSTIGIVTIQSKNKLPVASLIKASGYQVVNVTDKNQLNDMDSIVILTEGQENFFQVCDWLMNVQRNPMCFAWVVHPNCGNQEREVYLQLGVNGVIDHVDRIGEISFLIKNSLNRMTGLETEESSVNYVSPLLLNEANLSVMLDDGQKEISLTRLEYQTLFILYQQANTAVTYEEIQHFLWKEEHKSNQKYRVANLIFHLRGKLEKEGATLIHTVRSKGYVLRLGANSLTDNKNKI